MFAVAGRSIGLVFVVSSALGLSACQATYDDTKGWANRLEASMLKEFEESAQESAQESEQKAPRQKAARDQSGLGWEENSTPADRQTSPSSGVVQQAAAKMVATPEGQGSDNVEAAEPTEPAKAKIQPEAPKNLVDDPTGPITIGPGDKGPPSDAQAAAHKPDNSHQAAEVIDPTGVSSPAAAVEQPALPKLKPLAKPAPKSAGTSGAAKPKSPTNASLVIHLSSLRSEAAAKKEWQALKKAFPDQLSAMSPNFRRTEIAERGTFYRVLAGPVTSKQAANRICGALKAKKQYCQVMAAPPSA